MPSGGCDVTPGYQLGPGEKINNAKLNQGFQPVVRVSAGAITNRELDSGLATVIGALRGKNLLCNGSFQLAPFNITGLQPGSVCSHELGPQRWVIANDAHRIATREQFTTGSIEIPSAIDFLRWVQSAALTVSPAYLGQRLEDVRRFSGLTVALSIYLRAAAALTVTPAVRQVFGGTIRIITGSLSVLGGGTGVVIDGAGTFRSSDVGATLLIAGPGFTTTTTTITAFSNPGNVTTAATFSAAASGLSGNVTDVLGSDPVVTRGAPLALVANTWTRLAQVFQIPDVSGKVIPDAPSDFTEFRVEVPQGVTFQIDFANAQLEVADNATDFERRLWHEDAAYARYYYETKRIMLSNNIVAWKPFISVDPKLYRPMLGLVPDAGTGGTITVDMTAGNFIYQTANHSSINPATVQTDAEIRIAN